MSVFASVRRGRSDDDAADAACRLAVPDSSIASRSSSPSAPCATMMRASGSSAAARGLPVIVADAVVDLEDLAAHARSSRVTAPRARPRRTDDVGQDRAPILRRRVDRGHARGAGQRHLQRLWDGCRGHARARRRARALLRGAPCATPTRSSSTMRSPRPNVTSEPRMRCVPMTTSTAPFRRQRR